MWRSFVIQYSKIDLGFHDFHCNCIITPFYIAETGFRRFSWTLNSTETFKIGHKILGMDGVNRDPDSRHEKLNLRSRGFNSRAFYAQGRLVYFEGHLPKLPRTGATLVKHLFCIGFACYSSCNYVKSNGKQILGLLNVITVPRNFVSLIMFLNTLTRLKFGNISERSQTLSYILNKKIVFVLGFPCCITYERFQNP